MVRLQFLTGMRADEVMVMRGADLTASGPIREFRPADHKGSWRGRDRLIFIGPRAREVLRGFLKPDPAAYLFDPMGAAARKGRRTRSERAKLKQSRPGEARNPRYDRRTFRQAIVRACDRAFPHPTIKMSPGIRLEPSARAELVELPRAQHSSPLRLRHTAATEIRARYGLETAQVVLGHAKADTTEIYAERDHARARAVMGEAA
jgi:integrase